MVTDTELGTLPGVPQPVKRLRPITLAASRTINCRLRRFLKPKKQSATANVAPPGNSGKELLWEFRPAEIVSVDFPLAVVVTATEAGLKGPASPGGRSA